MQSFISDDIFRYILCLSQVQDFLAKNNSFKPPQRVTFDTFRNRAKLTEQPVAKRLFEIMDRKETNLCFSADVETFMELLELAEKLGACFFENVVILYSCEFVKRVFRDFFQQLHSSVASKRTLTSCKTSHEKTWKNLCLWQKNVIF